MVDVVLNVTSTLVKTPHSEEFLDYVEEKGVEHFRIVIPAHKTPFSIIPIETLLQTLRIILNHANYPLLIHCNKGKVHTKLPRRLGPHLTLSTASNGVHGRLLSEIERLDRRCHYHGVSSSQLHKSFVTTRNGRLTWSQIPQIRRGQIPPSRRSIHRFLQCRSGTADSRWRGSPLRTSPDGPRSEETRKPAAFPLEQSRRSFPAGDRRLGRHSSHAAAL